MREEKLLGLRAGLQVGGRGFGKFSEVSTIFSTIFWKISTIFSEFSAIFWKIFPKFFAIFFDFCDFPMIFPENFSENSCSQSVTVRPGSRHYCKFTSKFTIKFTPILIKILQSTKFEGSHFYSFLATFTTFYRYYWVFITLCPLPKPFPLFALFSLRRRVFPTIAPPCQRYQRPSLPLRHRRYVGNTRDYKQDYKSYCKSAYELATGAKAHEKPRKNRCPFRVPPSTSSPSPSRKNSKYL